MPDNPSSSKGGNKVEFSDVVQEVEATDEQDPPKSPLYKSSRVKGYITLILTSIINYTAARDSDLSPNDGSTDAQRAYAESVALCSCLISCFIFLCHLDRFTPLRHVWQKAFGDGSRCELLIILFLVLWWTIATGVITSIRGIAGDGRQQYNLYYSTWVSVWTSYWMLERWLVAFGWASFKSFITSWPFRAPGWIAICGLSFFTLLCYLDLYSWHDVATEDNPGLAHHYADVPSGQWEWLIFVGIATVLPSIVFIVIELFRETTSDGKETDPKNSQTPPLHRFSVAVATSAQPSTPSQSTRPSLRITSPMRSVRNLKPPQQGRQAALPEKGNSTSGGKGQLENIFEGLCLVLLVLAWIATVCVATTPGGAASLVGNAYFFTWFTTVFVMETFIWFVHDLRKGVHSALLVKEREYQKFQHDVLQKSRALQAKRMAAGSWQNEALDDIELDDIPVMDRMDLPGVDMKPLQHYDSSSQEDESAKVQTAAPKNQNSPDGVGKTLNDSAQRRYNVRNRNGAANLNGDDAVPQPPHSSMSNEFSPRGSTLFFDAEMEEKLGRTGRNDDVGRVRL